MLIQVSYPPLSPPRSLLSAALTLCRAHLVKGLERAKASRQRHSVRLHAVVHRPPRPRLALDAAIRAAAQPGEGR